MRLAIGNDHSAVDMKQEIMAYLRNLGHEVINVGTDAYENCDAQIYGFLVARMIAEGQAEGGILICGTGVGISLAANKLKGIRAALCSDPLSARLARQQLNANIIAFGARVVGVEKAKMIVEQWLSAEYQPPGNQSALDKIREIEETQHLEAVGEKEYES
ncbi:MAG: ribose 5-phosphate isomerase B [Erysipelotrichaceae bacterium]|nr:ribose 5-phosphate isomerase B [Erysipelotrichaceae bacterium]